MELENIKKKIKAIVCEYGKLQEDQVADHVNLHEELGIDSLSLIEIALRVDQEYSTDFSEEELLGMSSVDAAAELVVNRLALKT